MLVIISGCDRSGKSTIAKKLAKEFNAEYTHFSAPKSMEEGKKEYYDFIDKMDPEKLYINDRFYEGEFVYAPIYRGYQLNYSREIEKKIQDKTKVLFIYVKADVDVIRKRIERCGEDFVKDDDLETVINNYEEFMKQLKLPYIVLENNTREDLKNNINICKEKIQGLFN